MATYNMAGSTTHGSGVAGSNAAPSWKKSKLCLWFLLSQGSSMLCREAISFIYVLALHPPIGGTLAPFPYLGKEVQVCEQSLPNTSFCESKPPLENINPLLGILGTQPLSGLPAKVALLMPVTIHRFILLIAGYLNNEKATSHCLSKDGWFYSGDIGYYDDEHNFYIVDRLKELIKYKGFQVSTFQVPHYYLTDIDLFAPPPPVVDHS